MSTRTVTWGDALLVKAVKNPGGLNKAVDNIRGVIGTQIGVRNSFAKLYNVQDPADLNATDKWRAWLLLAAIGEDAAEWGIYSDVVPAIHADRIDTLRRLLGGKTQTSDYKGRVSRVEAKILPRVNTPLRSRPSNRSGNTGPKSSR